MAGQTFIERYFKFTSNPQILAIGAASVRSTELVNGLYYLIPTVDCFILQGNNAVVALATSNPLFSKVALTMKVRTINSADGNDHFVAVIQSTGPGSLYIVRAES
jgi:hypothetical protein